MLREFVDRIVDLARENQKIQAVDLPGGRQLLVMPNGEFQEVSLDLATMDQTLLSWTSLLDWCERLGDTPNACVEVGFTAIRVHADFRNKHLNDSATFLLVPSDPIRKLESWCKEALTNRQVIRALRTSLFESFDERYLSVFRRLDFSRRNDGSKGVTHTGESLGRSIETLAQSSEGDIPEVLVFDVPVYANAPGDLHSLRFAVEVDAESEKIAIHPVRDCISDAFKKGRQEIVDKLKSSLKQMLVLEAD